ncbi:MAG: site-specific DNA-methyltransferase [Clostridia bacterium]|nr:site-specific DNA-methyltransferase [Clostridia bacterium]
MPNLSQIKRKRMLEFLDKIKEEHKNDDETLIALGEIENELNSKKYGLVWEEHEEKVDVQMRTHIPVFTEVKKREISAAPEKPYNFLLEGDNLHSLYLLEKTHKGSIDLIYIDPPYNTGNSFIYDDYIVGDEDSYKHSKWASFIEKRLLIAKKLLSPKGYIFISIDDKELSVMRLLCDSIFGESRFLTTIGWEKRTKCQNTKTARRMLQPRIEYILVYKNFDERAEFNCHTIGLKEYPLSDDKGRYRQEEIGQMGASGIRGRGSMIFDILGVMPKTGNQWKIGKETVNEFIERGDLFVQGEKVYRKIRPTDETQDNIKPFWALFNANQYGTAESAKAELSNTLGTKEHEFETVKPIQMIEEIVFQATSNDSVILDFFAGSATTAQAVLEANKDYGGNRRFILCTNNENSICSEIAYPRIKTVITGKRADGSTYSDGTPANLKYYRTDFVARDEEFLSDALLEHIAEMIQLEHGVKIDGSGYRMIMSDEESDSLLNDVDELAKIKVLYISKNVLLTTEQREKLRGKEIHIIPDDYFLFELREEVQL